MGSPILINMMIIYKCNLCDNSIKKIFSSDVKRPAFLHCECRGVMEPALPEVSTTSVEVVDNGNMVKQVELRRDAALKAREKGDKYIKAMEERELGNKKDEY